MLITETTSPEAIEAAVLLLPPGEYEFGDGVKVTITTDGTRIWIQNGMFHREDGPAIESVTGARRWLVNGALHREDGPAIDGPDGLRMWYRNNKKHREDGPAVEGADGTREWWVDGMRHRVDGPAVTKPYGSQEWWINGKRKGTKRKQFKSNPSSRLSARRVKPGEHDVDYRND
jgi:hypothetical protein